MAPRIIGYLISITYLCAAVLCAAVAFADEPPALVRLTRDGNFKQRPVWSQDGKTLLFSQHKGGKILLMQLTDDGHPPRRMTTADLPQYDATWSPDGRRIAWTRVIQSPGQGNLDIYTSLPDGSEMQQVAGDQGPLSHEEWASWSADGKRIAFTSTSPGNQELFVADIDGGNRTRLTNDPAFDAHPAWSPDGSKLALATSRWGDFEIALVDPDGSGLTRLTESRGLDDYPVWSPDGKQIAFTSNRDGNFEIYVMQADGSQPTNITQNPAYDHFPGWSPDGRLTFASNRGGSFDLYQTTRSALLNAGE